MVAFLKLHNLPKSTRALLAAIAAVSAIITVVKINKFRYELNNPNNSEEVKQQLQFHNIQIPYLQLIPRYALFYPWVVVTAIFAEISVFSFLVSLVVLYVATKYVEKFWGSREVVKFVVLVGSVTNFLTVLVTIICNLLRDDVSGMDRPLGGGISYYFGFLVVLKQLIPEHNILLFQGLVNFRVKQFPFILLVVVVVWSAVFKSLYPVLPSVWSFLVSYIYLRFYQSFAVDPLLPITTVSGDSSNSSVITGDASDTFQLAEFFPPIVKPYLAMVFDRVYDAGVFLGVVTPFNDDNVEQSNLRAIKRQEQVNQVQKSVANSVAERRRQVALQVIEDRLNKVKTNE